MLKHAHGKAVSAQNDITPHLQRKAAYVEGLRFLKEGDKKSATEAFFRAEIANLHIMGAPHRTGARV